MRYETNDKVIFKYKGEFQVGVITGKSKSKDSIVGYYIRSEKGSAYSLVPVDKKRRKGYDYAVIDSAMTAAWNKAVEKGEAKETNLFAKDGWGHTRANFDPSIKLRFDGEKGDMGHIEKRNDFIFPTQGPRSF
jgi:hypothetical protein|tara:strand:- start:218 stop:616 length:399 start_codon:yes stop_codon:yes gene_type:complete